nr:hypothetical protein [Gammaproteobacteria bacterium]NIV19872.1 hypothetical protein [Gammaproteobacteria bacterium]
SPSLALLPLSAVLTILVLWRVSAFAGKRLALSRQTLGTFVVGAMIMNLAVEYPFVLAAWGDDGIARLALFDFGNGVVTLTFTYALACWYGAGGGRVTRTLRGLAAFPPFWALVIALAMNGSGVSLPDPVHEAVAAFGRYAVLLVMVALGIHFDLRQVPMRPALTAIALRCGVGLLLGWAWVSVFALEGLARSVVLVGTAAPVGFNTLVFASLENLDRELAAGIVSLSLLLAMVYLPVLLLVL